MKVTGGGDGKEPEDKMASVLDASTMWMWLTLHRMMVEAIERTTVNLEPKSLQ